MSVWLVPRMKLIHWGRIHMGLILKPWLRLRLTQRMLIRVKLILRRVTLRVSSLSGLILLGYSRMELIRRTLNRWGLTHLMQKRFRLIQRTLTRLELILSGWRRLVPFLVRLTRWTLIQLGLIRVVRIVVERRLVTLLRLMALPKIGTVSSNSRPGQI